MRTSRDFALAAVSFLFAAVMMVTTFQPVWWSIGALIAVTIGVVVFTTGAVIEHRRERSAPSDVGDAT